MEAAAFGLIAILVFAVVARLFYIEHQINKLHREQAGTNARLDAILEQLQERNPKRTGSRSEHDDESNG